MQKIKLTQIVCSLFPPLIAQSLRNSLYPRNSISLRDFQFSRKSITGSILKSNSSDFHGYSFLFHGYYDWRNIIIARSVYKCYKGDLIEIGANVGTETVSYIDIVGDSGKVHAFEPLPDNIKALNQFKFHENFILNPIALSNEKAIQHFQIPPKSSSGTGKILSAEFIKQNETIQIKSDTLDNYTKEINTTQFISIDTEGHEPNVLEGAIKLIKTDRPIIVIEVSPKLLKKYSKSSPQKILDFFINESYLCFKISRITLEPIHQIEKNNYRASNWLCIPNEKKEVIKVIKRDLIMRSLIPWYLLKSI